MVDAVFTGAEIQVIKTPIRAPRANAIAERFVGSSRRELLDRILIMNQRHAAAALSGYRRLTGVTSERVRHEVPRRVLRPGNLMSFAPGRLADLVLSNLASGTALVCHLTAYCQRPEWARRKGFFDAYGDRLASVQVRGRLAAFFRRGTPNDWTMASTAVCAQVMRGAHAHATRWPAMQSTALEHFWPSRRRLAFDESCH